MLLHSLARSASLGRACLARCLSSEAQLPSALLPHILSEISSNGPMTIAKYMSTCLTHPFFGYYSRMPVFGAKGDFITSPEMSQVFGELLAVWYIARWDALGRPANKIAWIEVGPGRGSLAQDMMRSIAKFPPLASISSFHLVETSDHLQGAQCEKLCGAEGAELREKHNATDRDSVFTTTSKYAHMPVSWYRQLQDVPAGETEYITAHELFDALPYHMFKLTREYGWREMLIDRTTPSVSPSVSSDSANTTGDALRFVVSARRTDALDYFLKERLPHLTEQNIEFSVDDAVEMSIESEKMARGVAQRIGSTRDSAALIVDYGSWTAHRPTLRAMKNHASHALLSAPGEADITADVDFSLLSRVGQTNGVTVKGPVDQGIFLQTLGIAHRLERLLEKQPDDKAREIISACERLVHPEHMGGRFKVLAYVSKDSMDPIGF